MDWTTWGFAYNYIFWLVNSFQSLFSVGQDRGGHFAKCVSGHTFFLLSQALTCLGMVPSYCPTAPPPGLREGLWFAVCLLLWPFCTNEENLWPLQPPSSSLNAACLYPLLEWRWSGGPSCADQRVVFQFHTLSEGAILFGTISVI